MPAENHLLFGDFRLDPANACVWRGKEEIRLPPTTFALLRYFLEHPGRIIRKQTLLEAVWPGVYVGDATLAVRVREIRKVLGDDPKTPQFIETVHRRGYRFIVPVTISDHPMRGQPSFVTRQKFPLPDLRPSPPLVVGRDAELAQLEAYLAQAFAGRRQFVFISGEAGSGKTALVDLFMKRVRATGQAWIGRGQCVEHYREGEPYLPLLEALGRLDREPGGEQVIAVLRRYAPTWLVQLPALVDDAQLEALQRKVQGTTHERMLREMVDAETALTAERGVVFVCEDLQWCDYSTLELLAYTAQCRERARLLVIGTYRPAEVAERGHPLKHVIQELQGHGQCEELRLAPLTAKDIKQYLSRRLAGTVSATLPDLVYRRTGGNALFMVNVIEYCVQQGLIAEKDGHWELTQSAAAVEAAIPPRLRQMIQTQIEKLSVDEQQVLEGASVVGTEFSAAAAAAGIKQEVETVEETCETLARKGYFLQAIGLVEWPDGTVSGRYRFRHGLYQNVLYEQIGEARRVRLHALIGEREEVGYGESAREFAGELAIHFERGRDYRCAALYQQQAGENALRYSAPREAVDHVTKGLAFLKLLPDTPARTRQELALQTALGASLALTQGYGAPAVEQAYTRAVELCRAVADTTQLFPTLWGLWVFYNARGELQTARGLAEQLLQVAQGQQNPWFRVQAHYALGVTLFWCGELIAAREQWEQGLTLYDAQPQHSLASSFLYGEDAPIIARCDLSLALELLGYSDQARVQSRAALTAAQEEASPLNVILTSILLSFVTQFRQDAATTQVQAETVIALATEHSTPFWVAAGMILRGWALTKQGQGEEGIAQMLEGLHAWRAMGAALMRTYWLGLLADAYVHTGRIEEGLQVLKEAQADMRTRGEYICASPFQRWKGELALLQVQVASSKGHDETNQKSKGKSQKQSSVLSSQLPVPNAQSPMSKAQSAAEACFLKAIEIARRQGAKALELRATLSLVRLWQSQGKQHAARNTLSEIYSWFTEGLDTKDLQEARTLLAALA